MSTHRRSLFRAALAALFTFSALLSTAATSTATTSAEPAVWVGSPSAATWPTGGSLPSTHHTPYGGDWSADLQSVGSGAAVVLYAAPQDGAVPVTAKVEVVRAACASGVISQGGYRVTVGLYTGGTKIGAVTYAHVNPTVSQGATINRWGTTIGTVGDYSWSSCWQGRHVHVEMYSQHNYACYNRTWAPGQAMQPTNFIGFVGGAYASGRQQACP
ncbi:hypothetical protein [Actinokineospora sp. NBRC 105648]|uniref:hypothetical protein n=1 Tax=Actinokineospora sp. NBRC 105648 TaxID=3032206 RepID=UPI0024A20B88|nr:hypothetical protein [Actinokineospora sp. NBRC 105648]GLZ38136.1 hypothetical protein Acsp05_17600 [Actinokineospora sp. NBRC 105648]